MVDPKIMRETQLRVMKNWDWMNTWGWDYPMMAMTAARLGEGQAAIQALLMSQTKNMYWRTATIFRWNTCCQFTCPATAACSMRLL